MNYQTLVESMTEFHERLSNRRDSVRQWVGDMDRWSGSDMQRGAGLGSNGFTVATYSNGRFTHSGVVTCRDALCERLGLRSGDGDRPVVLSITSRSRNRRHFVRLMALMDRIVNVGQHKSKVYMHGDQRVAIVFAPEYFRVPYLFTGSVYLLRSGQSEMAVGPRISSSSITECKAYLQDWMRLIGQQFPGGFPNWYRAVRDWRKGALKNTNKNWCANHYSNNSVLGLMSLGSTDPLPTQGWNADLIAIYTRYREVIHGSK